MLMQVNKMAQSEAARLYDEAQKLKSTDMDGCIDKLLQLLESHPDHVQTHMALAVYQQKQGRPEEAIRHAVRVTEIEPSDPFSFTQLSVIYMRCGKIFEAEEAMAKARMMQGNPGYH